MIDKKSKVKIGISFVVIAMLLLISLYAFAQTPEEEKAQLEAELAEIEQTLSVLSAGLGQDFGGLVCGVDKIKYDNYNCDNLTAFHIVRVLTVELEVNK